MCSRCAHNKQQVEAINNVIQPKVAKLEPAKPVVTVESPTLPVTIKEEAPKSKIAVKTSPVKEAIIEELRNLQTHDPDVIPVAGGRYGKKLRNAMRAL